MKILFKPILPILMLVSCAAKAANIYNFSTANTPASGISPPPACYTKNEFQQATQEIISGTDTGLFSAFGNPKCFYPTDKKAVYIAPTNNGADENGYMHLRVRIPNPKATNQQNMWVEHDLWTNPKYWIDAAETARKTQQQRQQKRQDNWILLGKVAFSGTRNAYLSNEVFEINGNTAYLVRIGDSSQYALYYMYILSCAKTFSGYQPYSVTTAYPEGPDLYNTSPMGWNNGDIMPNDNNSLEATLSKHVCNDQ